MTVVSNWKLILPVMSCVALLFSCSYDMFELDVCLKILVISGADDASREQSFKINPGPSGRERRRRL